MEPAFTARYHRCCLPLTPPPHTAKQYSVTYSPQATATETQHHHQQQHHHQHQQEQKPGGGGGGEAASSHEAATHPSVQNASLTPVTAVLDASSSLRQRAGEGADGVTTALRFTADTKLTNNEVR